MAVGAILDNTAKFQSTLPTRGSDGRPAKKVEPIEDVSIHAPHEGERPEGEIVELPEFGVSIHAPHEGERPSGDALR